MASEHKEIPAGQEVPQSLDKDKLLIARLGRWTLERMWAIPPRIMEAKARRQIAKAATADIRTKTPLSEADKNLQLAAIRQQLTDIALTPDTPVSANHVDSITLEPIKTTIRREASAWVAQEEHSDGRIISQARIFDTGLTELTLHFTGERYEKIDANPNLTVDNNFPRAAFKTFSLLIGTFKK